jgi:hypothetical protein
MEQLQFTTLVAEVLVDTALLLLMVVLVVKVAEVQEAHIFQVLQVTLQVLQVKPIKAAVVVDQAQVVMRHMMVEKE